MTEKQSQNNTQNKRAQAGEYLRLTLKYIVKYNLVSNLINLTVFYEYVEGNNNELNKAIDNIINENQTISADQIEQIYYKFFNNNNHQVLTDSFLSDLGKIIKELSLFFIDSMDGMASHGSKVEDLSMQISQVKDYDDVGTIIDKMLVETKALVASNKTAHSMIKSSSDDINILKGQIKKLEHKAQTDVLTGLANRRSFEQKLKYERLKAIENDVAFSVMMIDIDCFKEINDTHGHLAGDSVLKILSDLFVQYFRKNDFAARVGGDEFSIILPETKLSEASITAVKIKSIINGRKWRLKGTGSDIGEVTISIGIAEYQFNESGYDLMKKADDALYLAKDSGRNSIKTEKDI